MKRKSEVLSIAVIAATLVTTVATPPAWAQADYPDKPVRLVLPYTAGVSPDVVARLIADRLTAALGKPVLIDKRGGAGGSIGPGKNSPHPRHKPPETDPPAAPARAAAVVPPNPDARTRSITAGSLIAAMILRLPLCRTRD